MIELTPQQWPELGSSEPLAIDPRTQQAYVLVRKDLYERIKALVQDNGDWSAEEQLLLLAQSGKSAGWDDPEMNIYDNYDANHQKLCQ